MSRPPDAVARERRARAVKLSLKNWHSKLVASTIGVTQGRVCEMLRQAGLIRAWVTQAEFHYLQERRAKNNPG